MRSLAGQKVHENGYRIFIKGHEISPNASFDIARSGEEAQITLLENKLNILFNNKEQSSIEDRGPFSIDRLGNHSPPQNVMFGGAIGTKRIAEMVPLNYNL